jgi:hypothetical protein
MTERQFDWLVTRLLDGRGWADEASRNRLIQECLDWLVATGKLARIALANGELAYRVVKE